MSKYQEAIKNNQKFSDVKLIYLNIKELKKTSDELLEKTKQLYESNR